MAIFPNLEVEDTVQINDKTRLSAIKSFVSRGATAISNVEIEPEASAGYITVYNADSKLWYLDWQYSSAGTKVVSCKVTAGATPVTITKSVIAITSTTDALWSDDSDLTSYEPDILKWVPPGRNSFLNIHRKAQKIILDWFDEQRIYDHNGERLTKASIIKIEDFRRMSTLLVLKLIFEGISNKPDDVFSSKAKAYSELYESARERGRIRFDFDGDGTQEAEENVDVRSISMFRRG